MELKEHKIEIPEGCKVSFKIENGFAVVLVEDNRKFVELPDENGKLIKVYEGDKCWYVSWYVNNESLYYDWVSLDIEKFEGNNKFYHHFATEKAAQQYVENNKKRFSIEDINRALKETQQFTFFDLDLFLTFLKKCS